MLSLDRRRAFGPWFFIAIAAYIALYFNDVSYIFMDEQGDALATFAMAGSMGMVTYIMPLFAAQPFATAVCADWNSGFAHHAAMRSGNGRYLLSKALACFFSGGLATALGTAVFIGMLNLKFPQSGDILANYVTVDPFTHVLNLGAPKGLLLYYGGVVAMQFLAGGCWAMMALAFSAFCPNVLLTLCIPLAAYRLSLELYYWFEPPYWLNLPLLQDCMVELSYRDTLLAGLGVFGGLSVVMGIVFAVRAGRRLRYG